MGDCAAMRAGPQCEWFGHSNSTYDAVQWTAATATAALCFAVVVQSLRVFSSSKVLRGTLDFLFSQKHLSKDKLHTQEILTMCMVVDTVAFAMFAVDPFGWNGVMHLSVVEAMQDLLLANHLAITMTVLLAWMKAVSPITPEVKTTYRRGMILVVCCIVGAEIVRFTAGPAWLWFSIKTLCACTVLVLVGIQEIKYTFTIFELLRLVTKILPIENVKRSEEALHTETKIRKEGEEPKDSRTALINFGGHNAALTRVTIDVIKVASPDEPTPGDSNLVPSDSVCTIAAPATLNAAGSEALIPYSILPEDERRGVWSDSVHPHAHAQSFVTTSSAPTSDLVPPNSTIWSSSTTMLSMPTRPSSAASIISPNIAPSTPVVVGRRRSLSFDSKPSSRKNLLQTPFVADDLDLAKPKATPSHTTELTATEAAPSVQAIPAHVDKVSRVSPKKQKKDKRDVLKCRLVIFSLSLVTLTVSAVIIMVAQSVMSLERRQELIYSDSHDNTLLTSSALVGLQYLVNVLTLCYFWKPRAAAVALHDSNNHVVPEERLRSSAPKGKFKKRKHHKIKSNGGEPFSVSVQPVASCASAEITWDQVPPASPMVYPIAAIDNFPATPIDPQMSYGEQPHLLPHVALDQLTASSDIATASRANEGSPMTTKEGIAAEARTDIVS